jgi:predicted nucleic acid-binding protein
MFTLDTTALLRLLRGNSLEEILPVITKDSPNPFLIISIVSEAEIRSIARGNGYGENRMKQVDNLLTQFLVVDISSGQLIEKYVEIDVFSLGRDNTRKLLTSSRRMGKNDLWIAATAYITHSTLVTSDNDFDHLNGIFFDIAKFSTPTKPSNKA